MIRSELELGWVIGQQFAELKHRVADLEKILKVDLDKIAKDLFSDAAATDAAVSDNPVPKT